MDALRSVGAASLGAAFAYFLDPKSGRRRRAVAGEELGRAARGAVRGVGLGWRDLSHRVHGAVARARRGRPDEAEDDVLAARVRASLGRACSHPHALSVRCEGGTVELAGAVLEAEADPIVARVRAVRGVDEVQDHLVRHLTADVAALQGAGPSRRAARGLPVSWSPSTRLLVGGAGALLVASGALRRGLGGAAAALVGGAALLRGVTNAPLGSLLGVTRRRLGISIQKTMTVRAPVGEVFAAFTAFETFPRFMRHVLDVRRTDGARYHWKVQGPAGTRFEWDGTVLERVPDRYVSWTSAESASIQHDGSARFEPIDASSTRVVIRLSYAPPLGLVGHEIARLFGADPRRELDEDLVRFKSLLEQGKATGRAGTVTRDELRAVPLTH